MTLAGLVAGYGFVYSIEVPRSELRGYTSLLRFNYATFLFSSAAFLTNSSVIPFGTCL